MFKPGQVIRSRLSGNLALVQLVNYDTRQCQLYVLSGPSAGETLWPFPPVDPFSEVIGNNYKERPTTQARPKTQAQPGDVFKRWFGDLPELRGCRKEDC